jgi:replication factor C subunit 2/4
LGPELVPKAVLELNASDERGIQVVREQIKMFAKKKVVLPQNKHKIIILDEADSMTSAAQQALRRIMEEYSSTTRFALACNQSSNIIEPIQSRCAILRFQRLSDSQILRRLQFICQQENVEYTDDGIQAILFTADGDMRQAINNLQSTASGFGVVNHDTVLKVCDQPHPKLAEQIIELCEKGQLRDAEKIVRLNLWSKGYNALDIIGTIFKVLKYKDMNEFMKVEFIKEVAFAHKRALEGVASLLQLTGMLAKMCSVAKEVLGA